MGVYSGKYGAVNGRSAVKNWSVSETTSPAEFRASNTQGGTARREGVYDYTGTFEGYAGTPPIMPGEYFDFVGFTAPTTGAWGTSGAAKSATNAIVEEVTINWDWSTCELLSWSASFAAGEPLILSETTPSTTDTTLANPEIICGTKITLTASDTVWTNLVRASLTITSNNPTFVNSSTSCTTGRRPGIIDWNATVTEQAAARNANLVNASCVGTLPIGASNIMKFWVDGTDYWSLYYGHLASITDLRVDMDTGAIIEQTNNFVMDGMSENQTLGHIGRPGEDGGSNPYWWPDEVIADTLPF